MSLGLSAYDSSSGSESETDVATTAPPSKKQQTVKIFAPKLKKNDSSDEDEPPAKKQAGISSARSGLFSKLPPPRNSLGGQTKQSNRPLIPYVFSKPKPQQKVVPAKKPPIGKTVEEVNDDSDTSDTETNFFSYVDKSETVPETDTTNDGVSSLAANSSAINSCIEPTEEGQTEASQNETILQNDIPSHSKSIPIQGGILESQGYTPVPPPPPYQQIPANNWSQDEQFLRIQGKKNRKEKIEFIDINADDALEGNKELLLKSISEEKDLNRMSHSKKKNKDAPSSMSKKKHQMSYLIHQAKARELELKNAWAAGREARKASRMRYGF